MPALTSNPTKSPTWRSSDNLGTVRDLATYDDATDETDIVDHYVYDAFGNETSGTLDFLFAYTGRAFDDETGLQNNLNRWYDPAVGRWLSEDPIGFAAGDANVYRYVGNAVTLASDPNGLANLWNPWTWGRSDPDQSWGDFFNPAETAEAFGSGVKTGTKGVVNATAKTAASTATLGFCEIDEVWEPTNRDIAQGYAISEGIGRVITEGAAGVATGALGKVGKLGKAVAAFDAAGNAAGVGRGATDIVQNGANIGNVTETLAGAAGLGGNAAGTLIKKASKGLFSGLANTKDLIPSHRIKVRQGSAKKAFDRLKADIRANGIQEPIKYVECSGKKYVVDGHHRLRAALEIGLDDVPVQQVELPFGGYKTPHDLMDFFNN